MVLFWDFFDVAGPCRGPRRVGSGPGDVFTCVLTNFHRKRAAGDRVMRLPLFKLTSIKLTSIKFRAYMCFVIFRGYCLEIRSGSGQKVAGDC